MTQVYGTARAVSSTPAATTAMLLVKQRHAVRMELADGQLSNLPAPREGIVGHDLRPCTTSCEFSRTSRGLSCQSHDALHRCS
jgi:hypothetical protein